MSGKPSEDSEAVPPASRPVDIRTFARLMPLARRIPFRLRAVAASAFLWQKARKHRDAYTTAFLQGVQSSGLTIPQADLQRTAAEFSSNEWRRLTYLVMILTSPPRQWTRLVTKQSLARSNLILREGLAGPGVIIVSGHIGVSATAALLVIMTANVPLTVIGGAAALTEFQATLSATGLVLGDSVEYVALPDRWASVKAAAALRSGRALFVAPDIVAGASSTRTAVATKSGLSIASGGIASVQAKTGAGILMSFILRQGRGRWEWVTESIPTGDGVAGESAEDQLAAAIADRLSDLFLAYPAQLTLRLLRDAVPLTS